VIDVGEPLGASQFVAGDRLFTTSQSGVELWNASSGARLARIDIKVNDGAHVDPAGELAAIPIDETTRAELRSLPGGELRGTLASSALLYSAAFDPEGRRIVTANAQGLVEIWDTAGRRLGVLRGHTKAAMSALFSPDGRRVLSASLDQTARMWNAT